MSAAEIEWVENQQIAVTFTVFERVYAFAPKCMLLCKTLHYTWRLENDLSGTNDDGIWSSEVLKPLWSVHNVVLLRAPHVFI